MQPEPSPHLQELIMLALRAGDEIMSVYAGEFETSYKDDLSPVTAADEMAERVILEGLARIAPGTPVVAEEAAAAGRIPETHSRFYLVDPLDGTREFVSRNGEFTVNIALVIDGCPQVGVVYAPAMARIFWGANGNGAAEAHVDGRIPGAWKALAVRRCPEHAPVVVASRSHRDAETEEYLRKLPEARVVSAGSSLKFCLVAAGEADLYPRFGRTMEWDTAAGHAVLSAAGGQVMTLEGRPLAYGKRDQGFANPAFIASA